MSPSSSAGNNVDYATLFEQSRWAIRGNVVVPTANPCDSEVITQYEKDKLSSSSDDNGKVLLGPGLLLLMDHVLTVNQEGIITHVGPASQCTGQLPTNNDKKFIQLDPRNDFLTPGCIDLHYHAPQYAFSGTATDVVLTGPEGWLEKYAFPAERRLNGDPVGARDVFTRSIKASLRHGTTTICYFTTQHLEPTKVLVDTVEELGQRALIGKVCMDRNAPQDYSSPVEQSLSESEVVIDYIHDKCGYEQPQQLLPRILPMVTPRFVPTCTPAVMQGLGDMAAHKNGYGKKRKADNTNGSFPAYHVTSHASESPDELAWAKALDEEDGGGGRTDVTIMDSHGLITSRCILAHCVYLTQPDMDLMKQRRASVAFCPLSNAFFAGGVLSCHELMTQGVQVGLGTDVAGGYSASMWNAMRAAVVVTKIRESQHKQAGDVKFDYRHAFYLATLGGAVAIELQDRLGSLQVGFEFDAQIVSARAPKTTSPSPVDVFDTDTVPDIFQKLCNLGDDRNITRVFVQGQDVTVKD